MARVDPDFPEDFVHDPRAPLRPRNAGVPDDTAPRSNAQIGSLNSDGGLRKRCDRYIG